MDFDVTNIFFEALEYPEYVRPFFFLKKQKESGWHKGVFLTGLMETYHLYNQYLQLKLNAGRNNNRDLKIEDIVIPIEKETNGKHNGKLTKQKLDELEVAILTVYEIDKKSKEFSDVEVISFVEYGLWFIKNEFEIQVGLTKPTWFRPITKSFFVYYIISEAPFLDFPRFKTAVRNLLWYGQKDSSLKTTLKNYYKASLQIVEIWNNSLFKIEQKNNEAEEQKELPETVRVEFKYQTLSHSWWNDVRSFEIQKPKRYLNQDFAHFAANVANLLASEVNSSKSEELQVLQKDFVKDFLDGIHELQNDGVIHSFIKSIKDGREKLEAPFANWFKTWFLKSGYSPQVEPLKGNGRIDLRVSHKANGNSIVEFKGWWNSKKSNLVSQTIAYLTEFEGEGYIFLIDDTKGGVINKYKKIITNIETGYQSDSWETVAYYSTSYKFYKSIHKRNGDSKTLYHFIFSIHKL